MKNILFTLLASFFILGCTAQDKQPAEVKTLTPTAFKQKELNRKALVVDVRTPEEFSEGHLDGAVNSDFRSGAFAKEIQTWNKDKTYYLYCASGNRSGKAAELMKEAGFKHIYNIGAYQDLKEAGIPHEKATKQ